MLLKLLEQQDNGANWSFLGLIRQYNIQSFEYTDIGYDWFNHILRELGLEWQTENEPISIYDQFKT
jgi:hypothetical protein